MANKVSDATKLNDVIFYSIDRAIRTYRQYSQKQIRERGFDITIDQWLVIKALLENPGAKQQELAEIVLKDNASITRIIELLVKNGWIERTIHQADRRLVQLTVTNKAKAMLAELQPLIIANRRKALRGIDEKLIMNTKKILDQIALNCK
ncbi:MarR family winged helix-turn-helix transcriptional regulator [Flavihumibacter fluvii]|uniref:MarR family winged helix-turn-helix transcriptional regulator n=1 Tax=Flavihumibacter fluvii TaxID=2838157 RepID=UPI001BDE293C|nr:MarR family transcriptional regulator [Flavihumibacter fluvii]ULQ50867.1 MarR family transcriptional regulator [Flavihumibacter fluvii]